MAGHKILVIDHDLASRNFVAQLLRKEGHTVLLAPSGKRGLDVALREAPELIIADPMLTDVQGEELALQLRADPRTARVPLIALSHNARTARLRSWLDSGFDDYVVKSPQVVTVLRESLAELLGGGDTLPREGGLLISFVSAKGGLGTSSLCANLAMCMAEADSKLRVAVLDLALPMGSIGEIVGYTGKQNLTSFARLQAREISPELMRRGLPRITAWNFRLLAGSPDPESGNRISPGRIVTLAAALKGAFEVVVVDLGRSLSRISLPLLEASDLIVVTASEDHDAARMTKGVLDYLQNRGVGPDSIYLFMNRPVRVEGSTREAASRIMGLPARAMMPHVGGALSLANHLHQPYILKYPEEAATIVLRRTAREVLYRAEQNRTPEF